MLISRASMLPRRSTYLPGLFLAVQLDKKEIQPMGRKQTIKAESLPLFAQPVPHNSGAAGAKQGRPALPGITLLAPTLVIACLIPALARPTPQTDRSSNTANSVSTGDSQASVDPANETTT